MNNIDKHLSKITEDYPQGIRLFCPVCGHMVEVKDEGRGPLLHCGKKMIVMATTTEAGFRHYPKGWSNKSVAKFGKTLSKRMKGGVKSKGFFEKCVKKMRGKVENPEGFCASVKDEVYKSTYWRGKGKSPSEVSKDVRQHKIKKFKESIDNALFKILEYEEVYFITQCMKENDRVEDKLLCLKKAYVLCGANSVCQQRIDRMYDAITGNFNGSGEAAIQREYSQKDLATGMIDSKKASFRIKLRRYCREKFQGNEDKYRRCMKLKPGDSMKENKVEELNKIFEISDVGVAAVGLGALGLAAGSAVTKTIKIRRAKKRCKQKYQNDPEKLRTCLSIAQRG